MRIKTTFSTNARAWLCCLALALCATLLSDSLSIATQARGALQPPLVPVIVQGGDLEMARRAVEDAGGAVTHRLGVIGAVAARVTPDQLRLLERSGRVRVHADRAVQASGSLTKDTVYPTLIGADKLHKQGITGYGVTIAVVDTGLWNNEDLLKNHLRKVRLLIAYDAIQNRITWTGKSTGTLQDGSGHGSHIASIAASSRKTADGLFNGVAPGADLVVVTALGPDGRGTYADVIRGIDWVVANRSRYGIQVLNLSLSAPPRSYYWEDPLNQAVMRAWQAGIVVVVSAGNRGPDPMTIGVPGNVPYVITVGALSDRYTPTTNWDDVLASFSSAGPTAEGFVKPELVAPGGHLLGLMDKMMSIPKAHPEFHDGAMYFTMSGTSQSAAVISGAAALLLQAAPTLTPDDVKCRLMATARPAVKSDGTLAYSVFQQGAGAVDIRKAVASGASGCANRGVDVDLDLAGTAHYGGRANQDALGNYYVMGLTGYIWNGRFTSSTGYLWSSGYLWPDGYAWSSGTTYSGSYAWSSAYIWGGGYIWSGSLAEPMSINHWVPQE